MNLLHFLTPIVLLATAPIAAAQTTADQLIPLDTVGFPQRRTWFAPDYYSFHAATRLSGLQVMPLLLRSTDSTVQRLALRAKRRYILPGPLIVGSYGLIVGSVGANPIKNPELAGTLALGSMATLTAGLVTGLSAPGAMRRAVSRYNLVMTADKFGYARPAISPVPKYVQLGIADTISVKRYLLSTRYVYRGIQLMPELQLKSALQSFRDPFINEGIRQNCVLRRVGGVIGAFSVSFLATYYMTRLAVQATGRRVGPTNSLVYYSLGGVAVSFAIGRITDKTTRQLVRRYNEQVSVALDH